MHLEVLTHSGMKTGTCEQKLAQLVEKGKLANFCTSYKRGDQQTCPGCSATLLCNTTVVLGLGSLGSQGPSGALLLSVSEQGVIHFSLLKVPAG